MGCESKIIGNPVCDKCALRRSMRRNGQGSTVITEDRVRRKNRIIVTQSGNAWIGVESRKITVCDRGLGIPVVEKIE